MCTLDEVQLRIRNAVVSGDNAGIRSLLTGGADPLKRLAIHRRHYETSLTSALADKFPAAAWLLGSRTLVEAARRYVREFPPLSPCIADYGQTFPAFLSKRVTPDRAGYVRDFATLEWHVGRVAVAADITPMEIDAFLKIDFATIADTRIFLQNGVGYLESDWAVDTLFNRYLTNPDTQERFELEPGRFFLEVRGTRGEFSVSRLDSQTHAFRKALAGGCSIGSASITSTREGRHFDPGNALVQLIVAGLVTSINETINHQEIHHEYEYSSRRRTFDRHARQSYQTP